MFFKPIFCEKVNCFAEETCSSTRFIPLLSGNICKKFGRYTGQYSITSTYRLTPDQRVKLMSIGNLVTAIIIIKIISMNLRERKKNLDTF